MGERGMSYPASEKLAIIYLVEQYHRPVRQTLDRLCVYPRMSGNFFHIDSIARRPDLT
jgi:hypothetical protein